MAGYVSMDPYAGDPIDDGSGAPSPIEVIRQVLAAHTARTQPKPGPSIRDLQDKKPLAGMASKATLADASPFGQDLAALGADTPTAKVRSILDQVTTKAAGPHVLDRLSAPPAPKGPSVIDRVAGAKPPVFPGPQPSDALLAKMTAARAPSAGGYLSTDPDAGTPIAPGKAAYVSTDPDVSADPTGGAAGFAREFWQRANPMGWIAGLAEAAKHPVDTATGLVTADPRFLTEAKEAADKGDYATAARKVVSFLSMGFGPELDKQADLLHEGRYAEGAGAMTGMATQFLAPEGVARAVGTIAPKLAAVTRMRPADPAIADALKFGLAQGVPVDAAAATDNAAVRAAQNISDRSFGGSHVASKAWQAQRQGLATLGEQLATKASPTAVSAEQAGTAVSDAVRAEMGGHAAEANSAYDALREIAGRPEHAVDVPIEQAPGSPGAAPGVPYFGGGFAKAGASVEDLFQGVLADARQSGFKGSADDLRGEFYDRIRSARSLQQDMAAESASTGPKALLADIRKLGGIRPFERDLQTGAPMRGDWASTVQSFGSKSGWNQNGGSSIFRANGLGLDDLVQQLKQDPKWQHVIGDEKDLQSALDDIGRAGPAGAGEPVSDVQHYLPAVGIAPGEQWWSQASAPTQRMAAPVDLRAIKQALAPIHDDLMSRYPVAQQQASPGLKALSNIVNGPDFSPLTTVDANLGAIKSIARTDLPELRSVSQGTAAAAVKQLDAVVRQKAASLGPEALDALDAGRASTIAKYQTGDVFEGLKHEPVKTIAMLTAPKDGAIAQLRAVAAQSPQAMPQIGRAVLDGIMNDETAGAATQFTRWKNLGPETKALLFKDPAYVKDLDRFFVLAKKMGENPNPSGSAYGVGTLAVASQLFSPLTAAASVAGSAGLSAFLHSPVGVKILTDGFGVSSPATIAAWMARARKFGAAQGMVLAAQAKPSVAIQ